MSKRTKQAKKTEEKAEVEKVFRFHSSFSEYLEETAKATGRTEEQVITETFGDGMLVVMSEETLGKSVATLKFMPAWTGIEKLQEVGEDNKEPLANLKIFAGLREEFAPVSAGIEWYKSFTSGSGFNVYIDDPKDNFKEKVKDDINNLNRTIFQDDYIVGLDHILDIMLDDVFTYGVAAAEICYKNWGNEGLSSFEDFAEKEEIQEEGKTVTKWNILTPKWKKLGGIVQLKIINNAYERLKPYRDPQTYQVLYWTLDEEKSIKDKEEVIRFHTWQIMWLAWNTRGTDLFGKSVVKPVANIAILLREMQESIGTSFKRWSNRKYFFVTGTEKRPWAKPHIANFLKDIKKMVKENLTAIPVPAGFDVKDIGGEIFEGRNVLDHFTSMITGGMQYPRDFLEQGRTQAGDKAWLAWLVRYGRNQLQLRRAIEHQLWKRHLFCQFGETRKIPKQGVKKRRQLKVPIYVPKLEWRAEGKWHREVKLKMLSGVMNWANPADPPLKMGVQKDIAETLGYGEIDFSNYIKLMDLLTEVKMINAERDLAKVKVIFEDEKKRLAAGEIPVEKGVEEKKPKTKEEKLEEQARKRGEGGVSIKPTPTGKEPKPPPKAGGTREPKLGPRVEETLIYENKEMLAIRKEIAELELKKAQIELERAKLGEPSKLIFKQPTPSVEEIEIEKAREKIKREARLKANKEKEQREEESYRLSVKEKQARIKRLEAETQAEKERKEAYKRTIKK